MSHPKPIAKIGVGGGCHWCTEAVFLSLHGVERVDQGWIAPGNGDNDEEPQFSEGVIIHYHPDRISLADLIEVHLRTHKSQSNHSMRHKYRSAIYYFDPKQKSVIENILRDLQASFPAPIITRALPFRAFKASEEKFHRYYESDPNRPFCQTYIVPKLDLLRKTHPLLTEPHLSRKSV